MIIAIDNYLLSDIGNYKIGASKTNTGIFLHVPVKSKALNISHTIFVALYTCFYVFWYTSYTYIIIMLFKCSNDDQQVPPITYGLYED